MDQYCSVVLEIIRQLSRQNADRAIHVGHEPHHAEIVENGVGHYYHDPRQAKKEKVVLN